MSAHARLSGSSAARWIACPGSVALCAAVPERPSGEAAEEGTMAHSLGEQILSGTAWTKSTFSRKMEKEHGHGLVGASWKYVDHGKNKVGTTTPEMLEAVQVYVNHVRGLGGEVHVEMSVSLARLVRDGMWGTADAVNDCGDTLHVTDYKHGRGVPVRLAPDDFPGWFDLSVDCRPVNAQLLYYAAGALDHFDWRHQNVGLHVVQPRCPEVDPVQSIVLPAAAVRDWATHTLWRAAHAADAPGAPLAVGDHCRFCPALASCPAQLAEARSLARTDFLELPASPPVPNDSDTLARILRAAPMIDAWLRACEAAAEDELRAGRRVPGFKLVAKRSNRQWPTENAAALARMVNKSAGRLLANPNGSDMYAKKLKSPAQLEKEIGSGGREIVDRVAVKPDAGLTVAAESDRREAASVATTDFKELT